MIMYELDPGILKRFPASGKRNESKNWCMVLFFESNEVCGLISIYSEDRTNRSFLILWM